MEKKKGNNYSNSVRKDYSILEEAIERQKIKPVKVKPKRVGIFPLILTSLITTIICIIVMYVYVNNFVDTTKTKVQKSVTVTDKGIADAVEKVYDSVVVVENYVNDKLHATGTGFVYKKLDKKAYILTNCHVIEGSTKVKVVFTNNESVEVEVIGKDEYSDIAVLEVNSKDIVSVASIGSSEELRVGDTTFAVGAPLDASTYSWTVTRGILSGKNRLVEITSSNGFTQSANSVMEVMQTDAAINSGNSGGPLCNSNGEVIGITNMKIASSTVEGMGFAIPIETAISYADKYVNGEEVIRPYLGVAMYDVINKKANITGVYIQSVEKDSPAEKAGLKTGDVIVEINGTAVETGAYLKHELYKHNVGDEITVTYYRNSKKETTKVVLGKVQNS